MGLAGSRCLRSLERAELKAQLAVSVPDLKCDDCGWQTIGERWVAPGATGDHDDSVRLVEANPSWAAEFAVQGMTQVTRYSCPECKKEFALIAVEGVQ